MLLVWWLGAFVLYLSPWPLNYWHVNLMGVTALWTACCLALHLGWLGAEGILPRARHPRSLLWLPWVGLVLQLLLLPLVVRSYSAYSITELGNAWADQRSAFSLTSDVLVGQAAERRSLTALLAVSNLAVLTSVPYFAFMWMRHGRFGVAFLLSAAPAVVVAIASGRDSGLGPLVVVLASVGLASAGGGFWRSTRGIAATSVGIALLAVFFAIRRIARAEVSGIVYSDCPPGTDCIDAVLPTDITSGLFAALSYATQGFEGLGHALDAQWVFGGGFSHSAALAGLISGGVPADVVHSQLDWLGWSSTALWSTSLSWIANDVPWVLIPVVIAGMGFFACRLWVDVRACPDPINLTVFAYTMYALVYMPQNFTIGLTGPVYVAFLGLALLWLVRGVDIRRHRPVAVPGPT